MLDKKIQKVLQNYHKRIVAEEALMKTLPMHEGMARRDEFLLSVGEEVGVFLNTLVKGAKPKTILEVGTSYGYSTVWLAAAAVTYGGKVISLEFDAQKVAYAKEQIQAAGLENTVDFRIGDALESIKNANETFDFVLLDIWKELYIPCFDLFFPKLNPNAWVISDNMLFPSHHRHEADAFRKKLRATNAFDSVLMPIGSGIEISQYISDL